MYDPSPITVDMSGVADGPRTPEEAAELSPRDETLDWILATGIKGMPEVTSPRMMKKGTFLSLWCGDFNDQMKEAEVLERRSMKDNGWTQLEADDYLSGRGAYARVAEAGTDLAFFIRSEDNV